MGKKKETEAIKKNLIEAGYQQDGGQFGGNWDLFKVYSFGDKTVSVLVQVDPDEDIDYYVKLVPEEDPENLQFEHEYELWPAKAHRSSARKTLEKAVSSISKIAEEAKDLQVDGAESHLKEIVKKMVKPLETTNDSDTEAVKKLLQNGEFPDDILSNVVSDFTVVLQKTA